MLHAIGHILMFSAVIGIWLVPRRKAGEPILKHWGLYVLFLLLITGVVLFIVGGIQGL